MIPEGDMLVETSDSDSEDDMHSKDQIGKIPSHWYDEEDHIGYDLDGKKVKKGKQKDRLDQFLAKMDDPDYGRTIIDPITKKEIRLTDEEIDMIKRIQGGQFPDSNMDPYEDYVDWFSNTKMVMPLSAAPEPKRRFVPSKWEHKRVMKYVRAIRKGWMKPSSYVEAKKPEVYDVWEEANEEASRNKLTHIPAPKRVLPGHEESYNPPAEYLPTEEEVKEWNEMEPEDRPTNFLPKKYSSLRLVPAYGSSIQESFQRCLDLYLCTRKFSKGRGRVDPETLIPKLPDPKDLRPFPCLESLVFKGHTGCVVSISVDPTGQWLASGSLDKTVRFWEVSTGRCRHTMTFEDEVACVKWCPKAAVSLLAIAAGHNLYLVNPRLGPSQICEGTDTLLKPLPPVKKDEEDEKKASVVAWTPANPGQFASGIRYVLTHKRSVEKITWHKQGVYLATVEYTGTVGAVLFHAIRKQHTMALVKQARDVQGVAFHPLKPHFFFATKTHVTIYDLHSKTVVKKLMPGCKWISSIDIHPKGDNIILGSFDRRLCWFDLDLSVKPYKTLRYHKLGIRSVCYHPKYPLFASCGDEATVHVFHGMVYNDLMQNPLVVPLKILKGHAKDAEGKGVMDICFHPHQPWVFSAGADSTIRLNTN